MGLLMINLAQQEDCTHFNPEIVHARNGPYWHLKLANDEGGNKMKSIQEMSLCHHHIITFRAIKDFCGQYLAQSKE